MVIPPAGQIRGSRMGRGRQKAKHTKVARDLKYFSPDTDYSALQRELTGKAPDEHSDEESRWSEYINPEAEPYQREH